jgi:hypothetical protein
MHHDESDVILGTHKRATFLKVLPTFGKLDVAYHVAAQRLVMPVNALVNALTIVGEEIGVARNKAAEMILSLKPRPEFLFFFGDDMIPRYDALIRLWEIMRKETWDVLAALYYIKNDWMPTPILWRDEIPGILEEGVHYELGETVDTDICGLDFTLIRPEIFEKMKPPYFKTGPTECKSGGVWLHTEDAYFVRKVKQTSGRVGVATSVRVAHLDVRTGELY